MSRYGNRKMVRGGSNLRLSCKFDPNRGNDLEVRDFPERVTKSALHFDTQQTIIFRVLDELSLTIFTLTYYDLTVTA